MRGQKKSLLPTDSPSFVTCSPFSQGGPRKRLALGTTDSLLCSLPSQRFYNQVSTPLLKKIQFNYPQESVSDVTQSSFHNYFGGSEIVVAGKVDTANLQHLESVVTATAVSGALSRIPALGVWAASFTHVCIVSLLVVLCLLESWMEVWGTSQGFVPQGFVIASSYSQEQSLPEVFRRACFLQEM